MTRAENLLLLVAIIGVIAIFSAFCFGYLYEIREEVKVLRKETSKIKYENHDLRKVVETLFDVKIELHVIDKSTVLEVMYVPEL